MPKGCELLTAGVANFIEAAKVYRYIKKQESLNVQKYIYMLHKRGKIEFINPLKSGATNQLRSTG